MSSGGRHLYVADTASSRILAFPLTGGLAATQPDSSFRVCLGPTFIGIDGGSLLYVDCANGTVAIYQEGQSGGWTYVNGIQPNPPIYGPIAVDSAGHVFANISGAESMIYVYAPGASGRDAPMNVLANYGAVTMITNRSGQLYVSSDNAASTLVFENPESEKTYDSELVPTPFEGQYYGALAFDQDDIFWTRDQRGANYSIWQAEQFVERNPKNWKRDRHFETRDCWQTGGSLGTFGMHFPKWSAVVVETLVVIDGYLYYACPYAAMQSQYAVFAYNVGSGDGHKPAIESIGYPTVTAPFGLSVGP